MKDYLVFSDAHGNTKAMESVIVSHKDITDVLYLGDGVSSAYTMAHRFPHIRFTAVKGNCDAFTYCSAGECFDTETVLEAEGHRILLTHGHLYGVKSSLASLARHAQQIGCDIALYGHTHLYSEHCETVYHAPLWLFNPGSIGRGQSPTYGILHIDGPAVLFSAGRP